MPTGSQLRLPSGHSRHERPSDRSRRFATFAFDARDGEAFSPLPRRVARLDALRIVRVSWGEGWYLKYEEMSQFDKVIAWIW